MLLRSLGFPAKHQGAAGRGSPSESVHDSNSARAPLSHTRAQKLHWLCAVFKPRLRQVSSQDMKPWAGPLCRARYPGSGLPERRGRKVHPLAGLESRAGPLAGMEAQALTAGAKHSPSSPLGSCLPGHGMRAPEMSCAPKCLPTIWLALI